MKKILLGLSVFFATLVSAQYYPNNGWGNNYPDYGYYEDDNFYFPDDYYYEYPGDYYDDGYYRSFYNDYRKSITMVNWNMFFREFGLTRPQINLIIDLNRQFTSYNVWNSYYRMNPKRWWYDRFYALERILGPQVFIVFQNRYYNGYSPVVYYNNYWYDYYRPRYYVMPAYRQVNINIYKVNRYDYHRSVGNQYGWNQPRSASHTGGFREGNSSTRDGFRTPQNNSGLRNQNNSGFRTESNTGVRNNSVRSTSSESVQGTRSSGVRSASPQRTEVGTRATVNTRSEGSMRTPSSAPRTMAEPRSGMRTSGDSGMRSVQNSQRSSSPTLQNRSSSTNSSNSSGRPAGVRTR